MAKKNEINIRSSAAEYLTYVASVGEQEDSIEMRYQDENIWLTQKMMAVLYGVDVRTISDHIKNIFGFRIGRVGNYPKISDSSNRGFPSGTKRNESL